MKPVSSLVYLKEKDWKRMLAEPVHDTYIDHHDTDCMKDHRCPPAIASMHSLQFEKALHLFKEHLVSAPTCLLALNGAAMAYFHMGDLEKANAVFEKECHVSDFSPSSGIPFLFNYAYFLYYTKQYVESAAYFSKLGTFDNYCIAALNWEGRCFLALKDFAEAARKFKETLTYDREYPFTYYNLSMALRHSDLKQEALNNAQRAVSLASDYLYGNYELANVLFEMKMYDSAEKRYNQVLRIDPEYVYALYNLGILAYIKGDFQKAEQYFKRVIKIDSSYFLVYNGYGNLLFHTGKFEEAISMYEKARERNPDHASAYYNLGNAYYSLNMYERAIEYYREALNRKEDAATHFNLGNAFYGTGQIEKAAQEYTAALRIDPEFKRAEQNLDIIQKGGEPSGEH